MIRAIIYPVKFLKHEERSKMLEDDWDADLFLERMAELLLCFIMNPQSTRMVSTILVLSLNSVNIMLMFLNCCVQARFAKYFEPIRLLGLIFAFLRFDNLLTHHTK